MAGAQPMLVVLTVKLTAFTFSLTLAAAIFPEVNKNRSSETCFGEFPM